MAHLSFSRNGEQRLLDLSWDGATAESARNRARMLLAERFNHD